VEEAAKKIGDNALILLSATGDVISLALKHHLMCLSGLNTLKMLEPQQI
jgi:hypothetical protein